MALLIEWERSEAHARRGCDGCQEGSERGYYDLHRYLDDSFFHLLAPPFRLILVEAIAAIATASGALGLEADVHALDVGVRVPLALQERLLGDTLLGALNGGYEGSQTVDLDGVTLRQELGDAARHLHQDTLDDVAAVNRVVLGHVVTETTQGDRLLLDGLRVVLAVTRVVGVQVLTNVDFKLWILNCHNA